MSVVERYHFSVVALDTCGLLYPEPVVTFSKTEVSVNENEKVKKYAEFTVNRRGTHLNFTTQVRKACLCPWLGCHAVSLQVKYIHVLREADTAVEGEDFRLFTSDDCTLEGERSGGCISFSPGLTQATLRVEILPDSKLEGNETFHLKIEYVRNGRRHDNFHLSNLKVTIIDATERKWEILLLTLPYNLAVFCVVQLWT